MRSRNDIRTVIFSTICQVELDLERVEQDTLYHTICSRYDLSDAENQIASLKHYVFEYLKRENMLADMPSTNGPAEIIKVQFPESLN